MTYTISKIGKKIFVRELTHPKHKADVVVFEAASRNAAEWRPIVVPGGEVQKRYPVIRKYIETLNEKKTSEWQSFTASMISAAESSESHLRTRAVAALNEKFRKVEGGVSGDEYFVKPKTKRQSHCWNCKEAVDSQSELCHRECGWLICSICGACGCGYQKLD